jgi:hypothetical protein
MKGKAEEALLNAIEKVQEACITRQSMHRNQLFTGDPGCHGGVAYFAVCPDSVAKELHSFIDSRMEEFWREHGFK